MSLFQRVTSTRHGKCRFGSKWSVVVEWLRPLSLSATGEGSQKQKSMIGRFQQVPSSWKRFLDDAVKGEEPLRLTSRFESAHLPLSLAGRLMRDFGAVVGVSLSAVGDFA
jgi:hypothetical protein